MTTVSLLPSLSWKWWEKAGFDWEHGLLVEGRVIQWAHGCTVRCRHCKPPWLILKWRAKHLKSKGAGFWIQSNAVQTWADQFLMYLTSVLHTVRKALSSADVLGFDLRGVWSERKCSQDVLWCRWRRERHPGEIQQGFPSANTLEGRESLSLHLLKRNAQRWWCWKVGLFWNAWESPSLHFDILPFYP